MREMKDSGVDWIGEIPFDWKIYKIDTLYSLRTQKVSDRDFMPLSVTKQGIVPQLDTAAKTNAHDDRKLVKKGDFAINSRSDRRGSCGISAYTGSVSLINTVLKPKGEMNPNFFNWLFHTTQFADEFYKWGHGIVDDLWTTNWQDMKKISVPVPALNVQKQIADHLDSRCANIDVLLEEIQIEIDTLEQYKKSIITEVVTKGLNPDVEMKDSGIEWIGNIPKDWDNSKLGYECYIRARLGWKGLKAEEYVDEGYAFISAFNIQNSKLVWSPLNFITRERYEESPEIMLSVGDVLLVKDGAGVGKCARIDDLPYGETAPNSSLAVISTFEKLDYRYLYYYLNCSIFTNFVNRLLNGMGVPHLTQEVTKGINILLPSVLEQQKISDYLDDKCSEVDSIIKDKQKQLKILTDYKKSLIFEYVTGKREVEIE